VGKHYSTKLDKLLLLLLLCNQLPMCLVTVMLEHPILGHPYFRTLQMNCLP